MKNVTQNLQKSKKQTNILREQKTGVVSHHVLQLVLHRASCYEEYQEETYIASTSLNSSPRKATSDRIFKYSTNNLNKHREKFLTNMTPYLKESLPKNEGPVLRSPRVTREERQLNDNQILPNLVHKYRSIPELNTASEIRFIEENVRQNELLRLLNERSNYDRDSEASESCESLLEITDMDSNEEL